MPLKKSTLVKKPALAKISPRFRATFGAAAIFLAVVGVGAAAMLMAAREPSPADLATAKAQAEKAMAKKATASTTQSPGDGSAASLAPNMTATNAPAAESAASGPAPKPAAVTVTGCLQRDDETFRLKDTTGEDAPKSRSWKSGFLKKGSASIGLVDAANRLKLSDHVGQRVSVTGVLVDREMQARSLKRVAASCRPAPAAPDVKRGL